MKISFENIKKLTKKDKIRLNKILNKDKKDIKIKGGGINDDISLIHEAPNVRQQELAFTFLENIHNKLLSLNYNDKYEGSFKTDLILDNGNKIGSFHIRTVLEHGRSPKLILCVYDNHNNDVIHISSFVESFIHITINYKNNRYHIYFLHNPECDVGWNCLVQIVNTIKRYLNTNIDFFTSDEKWNYLLSSLGLDNINTRIELLLQTLITLSNLFNPTIKTSLTSKKRKETSPPRASTGTPPLLSSAKRAQLAVAPLRTPVAKRPSPPRPSPPRTPPLLSKHAQLAVAPPRTPVAKRPSPPRTSTGTPPLLSSAKRAELAVAPPRTPVAKRPSISQRLGNK